MVKVNLSTEKAKELAQNPKFMEELSSVINDEAKCLDLFKKYETELSKEEYQELLKFKKQAELLPENELKNITGGGMTLASTIDVLSGESNLVIVNTIDIPSHPLTEGEAIATATAIAVIGAGLAALYIVKKVRK